jgi:hypothetical protein
MPVHAEADDAQYDDRECANIQQCVDHGSHQHAFVFLLSGCVFATTSKRHIAYNE